MGPLITVYCFGAGSKQGIRIVSAAMHGMNSGAEFVDSLHKAPTSLR